jgi:uncharacterized coiled-coil DUF342 family protein
MHPNQRKKFEEMKKKIETQRKIGMRKTDIKKKIEEIKKKTGGEKTFIIGKKRPIEVMKKEYIEEYNELSRKLKEMGVPEKVKRGQPLTPTEMEMLKRWGYLHEAMKKAEEIRKKAEEIGKIQNKEWSIDPKTREIVQKFREVEKKVMEAGILEKLKRGEQLKQSELLLLQNLRNLQMMINPIRKEYERIVREIGKKGIHEKLKKRKPLTPEEQQLWNKWRELHKILKG